VQAACGGIGGNAPDLELLGVVEIVIADGQGLICAKACVMVHLAAADGTFAIIEDFSFL
jgi:hypothetical protein